MTDREALKEAVSALNLDRLPSDGVGLKLHRINRNDVLIACEGVLFRGGAAAVNTVLRRAAIAGRVEVDGKINDHFADVMSADGDLLETVALDAKSYASLKNKWMRCKVESHE